VSSKLIYIYLCAVVVAACTPQQEGRVLANAYGNKLYDTDLAKIIPDDVTIEDSVFLAKEYIEVWLSRQILLNKADKILTSEEKDKSSQLEQYRIDLLTYQVLNKLAWQAADTSYADGELLAYYDEHSDEFELSQNIIKIVFYKLPSDVAEIDVLWSRFKAKDESVYATLKKLSTEKGNYYDDKGNWVFFEDILKEIPINTYNQEHYLNNNKLIRLAEGEFEYFIRIFDFRIRSTTSPFSMEMENIKQILNMKRQQKEVKNIETKMLDEAYSNKEIKIF
jgi:hypothetical protein